MDQSLSSLLAVLVAGFTAGAWQGSPLEFARERGWVDVEGQLTAEGSALVQAMAEQSTAHSVFRLG